MFGFPLAGLFALAVPATAAEGTQETSDPGGSRKWW